LAEEVVDSKKSSTDPRANELKTALNISFKLLAQKLSQGAKIELSYLPKESFENSEAEQTPAAIETEEQWKMLASTLDKDATELFLHGDVAKIQALLTADPHSEQEAQ
jgi:hypothetical protein